jgi:hypothetical protein
MIGRIAAGLIGAGIALGIISFIIKIIVFIVLVGLAW